MEAYAQIALGNTPKISERGYLGMAIRNISPYTDHYIKMKPHAEFCRIFLN